MVSYDLPQNLCFFDSQLPSLRIGEDPDATPVHSRHPSNSKIDSSYVLFCAQPVMLAKLRCLALARRIFARLMKGNLCQLVDRVPTAPTSARAMIQDLTQNRY